MKKIILIGLIFCCSFIHANHYLGAEISYKIIDTILGRYKFTVHIFRDCSGSLLTSEELLIRKGPGKYSVPLNYVSKEEVTNICQVPDIATNIITNCPGPTAQGIYKGIEKWTYEVEHTIGRNNGWAYVAWTRCCRQPANCIVPLASSIWVQSAFNTNFVQSSSIPIAPFYPSWCKEVSNIYTPNYFDPNSDQKISINKQEIELDSIAYDLYNPMTGEGNGMIGSQPTCTWVIPLNKYNFIFSTSGVNFDKKTGTIITIPSIVQDGILALAIRRYRAIPNQNNSGYYRQEIGYTTRDIQFTVFDRCDLPRFSHYDIDSTNLEPNTTDFNFTSCRTDSNKIIFKVIGVPNKSVKIKLSSQLDTNIIKNFNFTTSIITGNTVDTILCKMVFNRKAGNFDYNFLFQSYYCDAIGTKRETPVNIRIKFVDYSSLFSQDTILYCLNTPSLRLLIPKINPYSWTNQSGIIKAENIDSSWIEIKPNFNQWYYVNNFKSKSKCKVSDSIYVKVDTCHLIYGKVFFDLNSNCSFESNIDTLKTSFKLKLTDLSNYRNSFHYTNENGEYYIQIEKIKNYSLTSSLESNCVNSLPFYISQTIKDTMFYHEFSVKIDTVNYNLSMNLQGQVSNTNYLILKIKYNAKLNDPTIVKYITVDIPDKSTIVSSNYNYDTIISKSLRYSLFSENDIILTLKFDSLVVGDVACIKVNLAKVRNENISDNDLNICSPAFTSYDPNNKLVSMNSLYNNEDFDKKTDPIIYTINFQNTGNAVAKNIYILDTIDSNLDISKFKFLNSSHEDIITTIENKIIKFQFNNIYLIDSLTNEKLSHGFVSFQILPVSNLKLEDKIKNVAYIFFDYNPSIQSNYTKNTYRLKPKYNVILNPIPNTGGVTYGSGIFPLDSNIVLKAKAEPNYIFNHWIENEKIVSDQSEYQFSVKSNHNLTAIFQKSTSPILDSKKNIIKISPNPAKDLINISFNSNIKAEEIKIYSSDGKLVLRTLYKESINTSQLERGIYIVEVLSNSNKYISKLVLE